MTSPIIGLPSPSVSEIELDGELSLFNETTGQALTLNRTATDVWALADGVATVDDVVAVLARAYGTTTDQIGDDVAAVLRTLEEAGALVPPPAR